MSKLQKAFHKLSSSIYDLSIQLYGKVGSPSAWNFTSSDTPQSSGNVVINNYSTNYGYPVWYHTVVHEHTSCHKCEHKKESNECEECKRKKNNTDWYQDHPVLRILGAVLVGIVVQIIGYVGTMEYLKWKRLRDIDKKSSKFEKKMESQMNNDAGDMRIKQSCQSIPLKWNKWSQYYRGNCRLYNLAKFGFVMSGLVMGIGLMKNSSNLRQFAYWSLVGSGCYTICIMTLYHNMWKTKEKNLMDALIQECNYAYLSSVNPSDPLSSPPTYS